MSPRGRATRPPTSLHVTNPEAIDQLCRAARAAQPALRDLGRAGRAQLLTEIAAQLQARRREIIGTADRESALGVERLDGELTRTCFQLGFFAEVIAEGSYLQATIDHPGRTAMGPRPDLRSMLVPTGPVAVFGASNFPLAFSVGGGDTAAALAAGCPVVVKAHPAHPRTSELCAHAVSAAVVAAGRPEGTFSVVYGQQAGTTLVTHPDITAVAFTRGRRRCGTRSRPGMTRFPSTVNSAA